MVLVVIAQSPPHRATQYIVLPCVFCILYDKMAKSTIDAIEKVLKKFIDPIEVKVQLILTGLKKLEDKITRLENENRCCKSCSNDVSKNASSNLQPKQPRAPTDHVKNPTTQGHLRPQPIRAVTALQHTGARRGSLPLQMATTMTQPLADTHPNEQAIAPECVQATEAADSMHNTLTPSLSIEPEQPNCIQPKDAEDSRESDLQSWKTVRYGKRAKRVAVSGTGEVDSELQTIERIRKIHACFFAANTSPDTIMAYMQRKNPGADTDYIVQKLQLKHNHYSSFSLSVPISKYEFFMSAENWPQGTEVSKWFHRSVGRPSGAPSHSPNQGGRRTQPASHHYKNCEKSTAAKETY